MLSSGFLGGEAQAGVEQKMEGALDDLREKYAHKAAVEEAAAEAAAHEEAKRAAAEAPDSDEEWLDEMEADPEMERIREARMKAMKEAAEATKEHLALGHGEYREIVEDEFLAEVTKSKQVVLHFYHDEFERCKVFDKHLQVIARKYVHTKFIHLNAEKAPFFVEKLKIRVLPTLVCFIDGVATDRVVGFDGLGADDFPTKRLVSRLRVGGVLKVPGKAEDDHSDSEDEDDGLELREGATYAESSAAARARVRVGGYGDEVGEDDD